MNNKHIACLLVLFFCVLIFQGVSVVHRRATAMQKEAQQAQREAELAAVSLRGQTAILDDLERKTANVIAYLDAWEPHLSRIATSEAGELNVNALLKQAGLILLAQRFELVSSQPAVSAAGSGAATIPQVLRAHLAVEDEFVKSIRWLGDLESKLPTARLSQLELSRGQTGNDVRMNLVVDLPLATPRATPTPAPVPVP